MKDGLGSIRTDIQGQSGGAVAADAANFAGQLQAFRDRLRERGHVEGRDIVIDILYADARQPGLARLAAELAANEPSVIFGFGPAATQAAYAAAAAGVPIVALLGDLVAAGMATELGRPGGRVTGVSFMGSTPNARRLELLAELLPAQIPGSHEVMFTAPQRLAGAIVEAGRA